MTQNSKLVNYFVKHFYTSEKSTLEHLVSLKFTFVVDGGGEMDFYQYALRKDFMKDHIKISFDQPKTDDDHLFSAKFKLIIPRVGQSEILSSGNMTLLVGKNLLEHVTVNYDQMGQDNNALQAAIREVRDFKDGISFI